MVDIDSGNAYLTTGSVSGNVITGGTTVKVSLTTKIDYSLDNAVNVIPSPVSGGDRGTQDPVNRIVDLKRIREDFTVQGTLPEEVDSRAIDKRNALISFMKDSGALTLVWGQSPHQTLIKPDGANNAFGCILVKLGFSETGGFTGESLTADISADTTVVERTMDVQIQLVRGRDQVSGT